MKAFLRALGLVTLTALFCAASPARAADIPESFLTDWTWHVNQGSISVSQVRYVPKNHQIEILYASTTTPERAKIQNYKQIFTCTGFGVPCTVAQDELGFARSLTVYRDGTMLYRNRYGVEVVLINADKIRASLEGIGR